MCTESKHWHKFAPPNPRVTTNSLHTPDSSRVDKDGDDVVADDEGNFSRVSVMVLDFLERDFFCDTLFVLALSVLLIVWPFSLLLGLSEHASHLPPLAFTSRLHSEHSFASKFCVYIHMKHNVGIHLCQKKHRLYTTTRHIPTPSGFSHTSSTAETSIVSRAHDKTPGTVGFDVHNQPTARYSYQRGRTTRRRFVSGS